MTERNTDPGFSIIGRFRSFGYAFKGLWILVRSEHNVRIHIFAAITVVSLGWYLQISNFEWCVVIGAIGLVLCAEAINTAIEHLADAITMEMDPKIKRIKDISAAAVLLAAITAAVLGGIIFIPKLITM